MSDLIHGAEVLPSSSGSSPSAISHHHRGPVASLSDQSIVPRILSPSSRTSQSQDSSTTRFDGSSVNDFTSTIASSSSPTSEDIEVPDPAIIDALKNAKERLFVLKLGEGMESLIDQRRYGVLRYLTHQIIIDEIRKGIRRFSSPQRRRTSACLCIGALRTINYTPKQMGQTRRFLCR